jgi:CRP-like cAMP-binding protein
VELELRQIVFDVDRPIAHVHFPEAAVVSVLSVMADGAAVETATVGREGMVGLPVFLGSDRTSAQAFAQVPGPALRMAADDFRAAVADTPTLALALHRYTLALFTLVAQGSACNRLHTMVERCARWLLLTHDRVGHDEFGLTHQFLSQMLGVRRATVTEAMGALQEAGAVDYHDGPRARAGPGRPRGERVRVLRDRGARVRPAARRRRRRAARPALSPLEGLVVSEDGRSTAGDGAPRADEER